MSVVTKKKKLISESISVKYDVGSLKTKLENDDPIFLKTPLQECNVKNNNLRIYSREILERELDHYQKFVKKGNAYGELDHPMDSDVVEFKNTSHRIVETWWKGDVVWGKIEILPGQYFPSANILRGCLKIGAPIGFSSRGYGSETRISEDTFMINDDYSLLCWDSVTNPSVGIAFGSVLNEGTSPRNLTTNDILNKKLYSINKTIFNILSN